jgi:putative transposase
MKKTKSLYHGHRFPAVVISCAVRWYFRFNLSLRDIEELLFERGVVVTYETSSYCRCVESKRISNGKKKGEGNAKNGNRYLAWAFVEAAAAALRCCLGQTLL